MNDLLEGIPPVVTCPRCGKEAKINALVDQDTLIDYFYECSCGVVEGHIFGLDLDKDLKELYGKNYEEIDKERLRLWGSLEKKSLEIKSLRTIIQNPVPVPSSELANWRKCKEDILHKLTTGLVVLDDLFAIDELVEKLSSVKNILSQIEEFVVKYHLRD